MKIGKRRASKSAIARAAFAWLILAIAAPLAASPSGSVFAADSMGRRIELAVPAKRIVSLSPDATETLYAIGAGPSMVGDTEYCNYPVEALALPKIGGFSSDTISVEKIVALKPSLVVTSGALHQPVEAALAKLGIPCFAYNPASFSEIEGGMAALGVLAGVAEKGRAAAASLEASLAKIRALTASLPDSRRPSVFWQVYDEPLMTCGADSFPHQVIELAGGRDIFADLPGPWPVISAEEVLRRAPQFILGPDDMGDKVDPAKLAARPGWAAIPAVRDKKVALLKADLVSRASPRIAEGALDALQVLHPELQP